MNDELFARQQAIQLRLAGQSINTICRTVHRSRVWFHLWWRRYRALGPEGLFDRTPANAHPRRISPELEQTILNVRQRLESQAHPATRRRPRGRTAGHRAAGREWSTRGCPFT